MRVQDLQGLAGAIAANAQPPGGPLTLARARGGEGDGIQECRGTSALPVFLRYLHSLHAVSPTIDIFLITALFEASLITEPKIRSFGSPFGLQEAQLSSKFPFIFASCPPPTP